jgi:hypothetical protein
MVVIWRPLTFVLDLCPRQHFSNTVHRPKPTLRRNRLLGRPIIVEDMLIMRDQLLSNRTPPTAAQRPPGSEEKVDGQQRANKRLRVRLSSQQCTVCPQPLGFPSTFEATTELDVVFWIEIASERRKVFSAVSIPEYIETWMELTEEHGADYWFHLGSEDMLCIHRSPAAATACIYRLRIQPKGNSLTFFWESIEPHFAHASRVEIVIRGRRYRTSLWLRHRGLRNRDETQLYSAIWRRSLDKLQCLLQRSFHISHG